MYPPRTDLSQPRLVNRYGDRKRFRVRDVDVNGMKEPLFVLREVDAAIADVLRICNAHGYPTQWSCSGMLVDHPSTQEGAHYGYIAFAKMSTLRERTIQHAARVAGMGAARRHGVRVDTSVGVRSWRSA